MIHEKLVQQKLTQIEQNVKTTPLIPISIVLEYELTLAHQDTSVTQSPKNAITVIHSAQIAMDH